MSKGSKPAGTTTVQQVNPLQVAQQPYLERGWQDALNLYNANPVKQLAHDGDYMIGEGYNSMVGLARNVTDALRPQATQFWNTGGQGSIYNSPAYNYFQGLAQGTTGPQGALTTAAQQAQQYGQTAAGGNLGLSQLGQIAQGQYLNANPYTAAMVQSAIDPVVRNYQTAVAPQIDASFEGAGRYGGGAMRGAQDTAQQNLIQGIGNISSNIYGQQFANERQLQNQAATNYGTLYNQGQGLGIQGSTAAADAAYRNLLGQQTGATGLQGGYQAGNTAALNAAQIYPSLAEAQYSGSNALMRAGAANQALHQPMLDAPWAGLQQYQAAVGSPLSGTGSTTSPYFQNQLANTLGGLAGGVGILNGVNNLTGGGISGLFGGGAGGLTAGAPGVLSGTAAEELAAAGLATDASGGLGLTTLASAAPVAESAAKAAPVIASDRRLKEDIVRIGELDNGLPVYLFKYKGDPVQRVGLMADEVEKVTPDAVAQRADGYKMVDYSRVISSMLRR